MCSLKKIKHIDYFYSINLIIVNAMLSNPYLNIIVSSAIIYLFITIAIRIFGKKELSQLSVIDLVFVLLISNAVQNAMVGSDSSLLGGIIAATTLFVINFAFKYALFRSKKLAHLLEGEPVILISKGKVHDNNLRKLKLTFDELLEAVREHGVSDTKEVDLAIFEIDGNISILSNDYRKRSVKAVTSNRKHRKKSSSMNF
jgi:uncharacterized membrane protein YcaP (DUF421 family)